MAEPQNSPLPPLYDNPVMLNVGEHSRLRYRRPMTQSFAMQLNSVPVVLEEIPKLLPHYPIAFTAGEDPGLIAILGARTNENLFVEKDGNWRANLYVPAYVRRYPFILIETTDQKLALGVQMDDACFGSEGDLLFFNSQPSTVASSAYRFCKEFQESFEKTKKFCQAVAATGLLKDKRSAITTLAGLKANLRGFSAVDEGDLDALDNRTANGLRKSHYLGPLYWHIASLERLQSFPQLLEEQKNRVNIR